MRLDLGRKRVVLERQRSDERRAHGRPVDRRHRGHVRVEVAHRAVPLAEDAYLAYALLRARETRREVADFLAEGGGTRRLSVRARQHDEVGIAMGQRGQFVGAFPEYREELAPGRLQKTGVA